MQQIVFFEEKAAANKSETTCGNQTRKLQRRTENRVLNDNVQTTTKNTALLLHTGLELQMAAALLSLFSLSHTHTLT